MKRLLSVLLVLCALLCATAQAETYYVRTQNGKALSLRSTEDNSILLTIPYGAQVETDDTLSNDDIAYIRYMNKAGYVMWDALSKEPVEQTAAKSAAAAEEKPAAQPAAAADEISIEVIGAYIQYEHGGATYASISDKTLPKVIVTAERRPEYWVINGIRYDFEFEVPLSFTLENVEENMVIEAVPAGRASSTQLSPDEIQDARTGEQLLVRGINAKLCHIKASGYGAGGWMNSFDFTEDFKNRATEQWEQGGQVTVRCKATIPDGKRIAYWKFDEMKIDFDTDVTQFIVRTLNVSKTYEPVFGGTAKKATAKPTVKPTATVTRVPVPAATATPARATVPGTVSRPTATPARATVPGTVSRPTATPARATLPGAIARPTATPTPRLVLRVTPAASTYRVTCIGCTFSGGGYSGASSGSVPAGTTVTVTANYLGYSLNKWWVNGSRIVSNSTSITRTINSDTSFRWETEIN